MKKLIKKGLYLITTFSLVVWTAGLVPTNHSLATQQPEGGELELTPPPECDLLVTKSDEGYDPATPGGQITYHITIQNIGQDDCTGDEGVFLKDFYDDNTSYASATIEPDRITDDYIKWGLGTLNPGQMVEVDLTMDVSEQVQCDSRLENKALWWLSSQNYLPDNEWITEHTTITCEEEPETSTIYAHKIVCDNESDIEWGSGGANITSTTAINYAAQHPNCRFVEEAWDFQWVIGTGGYAGDFIGPAPDWNSFDSPSTGQTPAMKVITADDLGNDTIIKVRENLKENYIPFSFDPNGSDPTPGDPFSAEMWCHTDVLNYDNYDFVRGFELGQDYYCVAFNVLAEQEEEPEECPDEENLITNFSFEEPVVTNDSLWQKMSSVLGWVIEKMSDDSSTTLELHRGWSDNVAANGLQYAELDGDHSTRVHQDVATEEGAEYKLYWSFAPRHNIDAEHNHLSIKVNGNQVATNGPATGTAPLAQEDWTKSDYTFIADGSNTNIALEDIGPSDSYGTFVDNVRLCKIADPEPDDCGDGILDDDEQCDDANNEDGDGCSAQCILEDTYECEDITSQDGWFGQYYNYLAEHPDMNLPSNEWPDDGHGDPLGTWDTDWYDSEYLRFIRVDNDLMFGGNFFPFDMAAEEIHNGHDYHFGIHWRTQITTDVPGDYDFSLTSDDDAWVYLNGILVASNPGIHAPSTINGTLSLDGDDIVDIFFAERHTTASHMSFSFDNPESLHLTPMPEDCEEDPNNICGIKFYDTDQNGEYDNDDYNISGWGISLAEKLTCEEGDEWADTVVEFNQGLKNDGTAVVPERSDPNNALGVAQDDDTINFVSLGFGGTLILGFDNLIENGDGNDVEVFETTYNDANCDSYPEYVQVYASQDGNTWEDIGNSCLDGTFDLGSLAWAQYIKLVDTTNPDDFGGQVDGYDVDGVRALHCYNTSEETYETETSEEGYCFEDVEDGYYHVCEEIRDGWYNTTPICQQVMISDGQSAEEVNFGNYQEEQPPLEGTLTICKQEDLNGDGILDDGEPVVPGWTFHIGEATYLAETGCVFVDLPYGTYNVSEEMQEYWYQTGGEGNGILESDGTITTTINAEMQNPIIYFLNEYREPYCGDGYVNQESEQCDDGNNEDGDGCDSQCQEETIDHPPSGGGPIGSSGTQSQTPYCGDDEVNQPLEQCDDGNITNGDGCSNICLLEEVLGVKIEEEPEPEVLGFKELPATGGGELPNTSQNFNWILLIGGLAIILTTGTIQILQKKN